MFRFRLHKVLAITAFWTVLSVVQVVYDELVYQAYESSSPIHDLGRSLLLNPVAALVGGPIAAGIVIFFIKGRLRRRPFWVVVLAHALTYVGITTVLTFTGNVWYFALTLGTSVFDPAAMNEAMHWFLGPWTLRNLLFWTVVATLTSFLVEVFDVLGPGFWREFVFGRYHRPRVERRTFMFVDLTGATGIAERLGPDRYHAFLNEFYSDVAEPVLAARGRIYQYVGDEVVVTWGGTTGLEEARCLDCYFGIVDAVAARRAAYEARYGVAPAFKASVHEGEVTAGEVGLLARDIVFTGDVLNTASRIQGRCRDLGEPLLVSADLVEALGPASRYAFEAMETIALRGRQAPTTLYAPRRA